MFRATICTLLLSASATAFADIAPDTDEVTTQELDTDGGSDTDEVSTTESSGCSTVAGGGFMGVALAGIALLSRRSRK